MIRMCDICGGVDDHPRHVHATEPGAAQTPNDIAQKATTAAVKAGCVDDVLRHIRDNSTTMAHMDCCAQAGCPDGSCVAIASTLPKALRGDNLREHLTSGKVDHIGRKLNESRQGTVLVEEDDA